MVNPDGGVPKCTDFLREFFLTLFTVIVFYAGRVHQGETIGGSNIQNIPQRTTRNLVRAGLALNNVGLASGITTVPIPKAVYPDSIARP